MWMEGRRDVSEVMAIGPDLLGLAICLFLNYLVRANPNIMHVDTKLFLRLVVIVSVVIVVEIASVEVDAYGTASLDALDELLYCVIYLAAPVTFLLMAMLFDNEVRRFRRAIAVCLVVYAAFILSNFLTHQLFTVTGGTSYSRGPLYVVYVVASAAAGIVFLAANNRAVRDADNYRSSLLYGAFATVLAATVIEALFPSVLLVWPSIALGLLLFYVYLRELQFAFDPLTGVRNRMAFSQAIRAAEGEKDVGLVMIDLNGLKDVNDSMGHASGDRYLVAAAQVVGDAFRGMGSVFRIGGDEFCVICPSTTEEGIDERLHAFVGAMRKHDAECDYRFSIAYGSAMREPGDLDLFATLSRADALMYRDKERTKRYFRASDGRG
jgi:diguanylate cyclase (GGDEF)-like protein